MRCLATLKRIKIHFDWEHRPEAQEALDQQMDNQEAGEFASNADLFGATRRCLSSGRQ